MYSDRLMDRLADVLDDVVNKAQGSWQEHGAEIRAAMAERDADGNLEEFLTWFTLDDRDIESKELLEACKLALPELKDKSSRYHPSIAAIEKAIAKAERT